MRFGARHRKRIGCRIAIAVLLSFFFQHAAIAAYACGADQAPAPAVASMSGCGGMESLDPPALCDKHCNPDDSTSPESRVAQVSPGVLPPPRFDLAKTLPAASSLEFYKSVPPLLADPPPTLRFCSLLI